MPFDPAVAGRWMKRELNNLRDLRPEEKDLGPQLAKMEAYAAGEGTFGAAVGGLMMASVTYARTGMRRVLDGQSDAWGLIDRSCLYQAWGIRLLACAYDADGRPEKQARCNLDTPANVWTQTESLGTSGLREWLEDRFRRVDQGDGSLRGKQMNSLVTLVAHFATRKDPAALERAGWADIGVYRPVASGTLRPADYDNLADYHTGEVSGGGFPAFPGNPFRLVPFELFAIEKRTGVPIEGAKHPLLTSPLAVRRTVEEIPMTPELQRVIDRARTEMPL